MMIIIISVSSEGRGLCSIDTSSTCKDCGHATPHTGTVETEINEFLGNLEKFPRRRISSIYSIWWSSPVLCGPIWEVPAVHIAKGRPSLKRYSIESWVGIWKMLLAGPPVNSLASWRIYYSDISNKAEKQTPIVRGIVDIERRHSRKTPPPTH